MPSPSSTLLSAVIHAPEVRQAYRSLRQQLEQGAEHIERRVGFQGSSAIEKLMWRPGDGFWALLGDGAELDHFWCAYGVGTEPLAASQPIVCEINPPHEGFNRRCGGVFLKDERGGFYLAHTGKVGGGRKGVGKSAFLRDYVGHLEPFHWPDGRRDKLIVIGRIGDSNFPGQLGHFVHEVARFKAAATQQQADSPTVDSAQRFFFTPEFSSTRASYAVEGSVEARCNHGLVVDALRTALGGQGLKRFVGNDQHRDLFVATLCGSRTVLFEVKTDDSSTSIYTGIGQLMLHGAIERKAPTRVLVLPAAPVSKTQTALRRLGVSVLKYQWVDAKPVFAPGELKRVLTTA